MRSTALVSIAFLALLGGSPAIAATIQAAAEGNIYGLIKRDLPAPSRSGVISAAVRFDHGRGVTFFDSCRALASQSEDGVSATLAECYNEVLAKADNTLEARTSWDSVINNTSNRSLHYVYEFRINGTELALRDLGLLTDLNPLAPCAEYGIEVRLNGNIIFESHGLLLGGAGAHVLQETGTDLGGDFFRLGTQFGYRFPTFDGAISLGFLAPGESLNLTTTLLSRTRVRLALSGAFAAIGDPLDTKGDPGIDSEIVPDETIGVETSTFGQVKALFR